MGVDNGPSLLLMGCMTVLGGHIHDEEALAASPALRPSEVPLLHEGSSSDLWLSAGEQLALALTCGLHDNAGSSSQG